MHRLVVLVSQHDIEDFSESTGYLSALFSLEEENLVSSFVAIGCFMMNTE
jgi:hypothetical protein